MTNKKDLKQRVRDRQEQTGERYTTALQHVRTAAPQPPRAITEELVDLSTDGEAHGLRCRLSVVPRLLQQVERPAMLTALREAMLAAALIHPSASLPAAGLYGRVAPPRRLRSFAGLAGELRRFALRMGSKSGTPTATRRMLSFQVSGANGPESVVAFLWETPATSPRPPLIILGPAEGFFDELFGFTWDGLPLAATM